MSLKAFHIVFVVASTLLAFGFGLWAIQQYRIGDGSPGELALGIGSVTVGFVLICYGRYFLRKLKHISYL
ncbi:MAG: hypothetical protein U1G07_20445 [Verrucomicrobiota bacterium]